MHPVQNVYSLKTIFSSFILFEFQLINSMLKPSTFIFRVIFAFLFAYLSIHPKLLFNTFQINMTIMMDRNFTLFYFSLSCFYARLNKFMHLKTIKNFRLILKKSYHMML